MDDKSAEKRKMFDGSGGKKTCGERADMAEKRGKIKKYVIIYACVTLFAFLVYYFALPPINLLSRGFWFYLAFLMLVYIAPVAVGRVNDGVPKKPGEKRFRIKLGSHYESNRYNIVVKNTLWLAVIPVCVVILGGIIGSPLFRAKEYASVITVDERVFKEDMAETNNVENVALMDTDSARIFGQRTLGELAGVVSQYAISDLYTQINYNNTPQKVANLEYDGFFKWTGNRKNGVPGYVIVDPVKNTSKFVALEKPMKYVVSAYFGEDLSRKLRFLYPTKIMGTPRFEIDESGLPMFVVPCYKPRIFMFGAADVFEVIIFDPCSGKGTLYSVGDVPSWVDAVFEGDLACEKYNWYGEYSGGFINSIIGNKGCKRTTDDYGYLIANDDVWYYTGVTSVTGDESNIGFILTNARTGEYKYYPVHGAEEHSAMGAAEGEVQEKGYNASFPALINVRGEATYIMVLKDANGIVKLYALVNVERYNLVATGTTQSDAMEKYVELLAKNGVSGAETAKSTKTFVVGEVFTAQIGGNTYYYFKPEGAETDEYYRISAADDESAIFVKVGQTITVTYENADDKGIYKIVELKR